MANSFVPEPFNPLKYFLFPFFYFSFAVESFGSHTQANQNHDEERAE